MQIFFRLTEAAKILFFQATHESFLHWHDIGLAYGTFVTWELDVELILKLIFKNLLNIELFAFCSGRLWSFRYLHALSSFKASIFLGFSKIHIDIEAHLCKCIVKLLSRLRAFEGMIIYGPN